MNRKISFQNMDHSDPIEAHANQKLDKISELVDAGADFIIFGGMFVFYLIPIDWAVVLPVCFTLGVITILFREFFIYKQIGSNK